MLPHVGRRHIMKESRTILIEVGVPVAKYCVIRNYDNNSRLFTTTNTILVNPSLVPRPHPLFKWVWPGDEAR